MPSGGLGPDGATTWAADPRDVGTMEKLPRDKWDETEIISMHVKVSTDPQARPALGLC